MYFSFLALFPLLPFTYGQYGAPDATSSSGTASTSSASSSTPSNVHIVSVGSNGLTFSPNSMTVPVGDQVEFHFFPPEHSVAQSSFSTPCAPPSNGTAFWSGFIQTSSSSNTNTFRITINDTNPIWYYCAVPTHCESGMVGVINPPNDQTNTLTNYAAAAAKVSSSTAPSTVQGGVIGPAASVSGSSTASATAKSGAGNIVGQLVWVGVVAPFVGWAVASFLA